MWKEYNANPVARRGNDCTVRAISTILMKSWEEVFIDLCLYGLRNYDMPSANHVWGSYLEDNGYTRHIVPKMCSVRKFAEDHPRGSYILALQNHVVAVRNGSYIDTWNSGDEPILYYWKKEINHVRNELWISASMSGTELPPSAIR